MTPCSRHAGLQAAKEAPICAACYSEARREHGRLLAVIESARELMEQTANMLRGMRMDPAIPGHAKAACGSRLLKLEKWVSDTEEK